MEEIKPDNKDFRIAELHVEGLSNPQIADELGINRSTVYRRLQTPQCKAVVNEIRNIYHNSLIARLQSLKPAPVASLSFFTFSISLILV